MDATDVTEEALARWLVRGVTSDAHPVLRFALNTLLEPLGIEADALEADRRHGRVRRLLEGDPLGDGGAEVLRNTPTLICEVAGCNAIAVAPARRIVGS